MGSENGSGGTVNISDSIVNRTDFGGSGEPEEDDDDVFEKRKYRKSRVEISDSIVNRRKNLK